MKIKQFMDFIAKDSKLAEAPSEAPGTVVDAPLRDEKIIYIDNTKLETVADRAGDKALIVGTTQWSERLMGEILAELGKLSEDDIEQVLAHQREHGLYFGQSAMALQLAKNEDILQALSRQFGYSYNADKGALSPNLVMAYTPFGEQAEQFRGIRGKLLNSWWSPAQKTLAVVSADNEDGRSHVAANLALSFSQSGYSTLLIDADMRAPRQHEFFKFDRRIGFSALLAGRIKMEELDTLPDRIATYQNLSVLGCGAVPPNPAELLNRTTFPRILDELKKYFDVIIFDTPPATYQADVMSIAAVTGSALIVTRSGRSKIESVRGLAAMLGEAKAAVVGSVLNQF